MSIRGERTFLGRGDRGLSFMDEQASVLTFAWLATHRNRLRTVLFRAKRWSVILLWDRKGDESIDHDEAEVAAMRRLVHGPQPSQPVETLDDPHQLRCLVGECLEVFATTYSLLMPEGGDVRVDFAANEVRQAYKRVSAALSEQRVPDGA